MATSKEMTLCLISLNVSHYLKEWLIKILEIMENPKHKDI